MGEIHLVVGRAGSGKTHLILERITERASSDPLAHQWLLVPDQFSFEAERQLLARMGRGVLLGTRVVTFARLAHELISSRLGSHYRVLDKRGRALLVRRLVGELEREGKLPDRFKRGVDRVGFSLELAELIHELRAFGWKAEDLSPARLSGLVRSGMNEEAEVRQAEETVELISELARSYEEALREEGLVDQAELGELVRQVVAKEEEVGQTSIFVDNFSDFTEVELDILVELAARARELWISLNLDPALRKLVIDQGQEGRAGAIRSRTEWTFYPTLRTLNRLTDRFSARDLSWKVIELPRGDDAPPRFRSYSLLMLEQLAAQGGVAMDGKGKKLPPTCEEVQLYATQSRIQEVELWARLIHRWTRREGLNYRDIAILLRSPEPYYELVQEIFSSWKIPFYLDRKPSLSSRPLPHFISALLEVVLTDFARVSVMDLLRSGLLDIPSLKVDLVENEALRLGIDQQRWFADDFAELLRRSPIFVSKAAPKKGSGEDQEEEDGLDGEESDKSAKRTEAEIAALAGAFEWVRDMVLAPIRSHLKNHSPKSIEGWLWDLAQLLRTLPLSIPVGDTLDRQALGKLASLFGDLREIAGGAVVTLEELSSMVRIWLEADRLGTIPYGLDVVLVSEVQRGRVPELRWVIVGGLVEGEFPRQFTQEGLVDTSLRRALSSGEKKFGLLPEELQLGERYFFYVALTRASEGVVLTRPLVDVDGTELSPSSYHLELSGLLGENLGVEEQPAAETYSLRQQLESIQSPHELPFLLGAWLGARARGNWVFDDLSLERLDEELDLSLMALMALLEGREVAGLPASLREETHLLRQEAEIVPVHFAPLIRDPSRLTIDAGVIHSLYPEETVRTSVTALEEFAYCPFKHFADRLLHLREREELGVNPLDAGSYVHRLLEGAYRRVMGRVGTFDPRRLRDRQAVLDLLREVDHEASERVGGIFLEEGDRVRSLKHWLHEQIADFISAEAHQRWKVEEELAGFVPVEFEDTLSFTLPLTERQGWRLLIEGKLDRIDVLVVGSEQGEGPRPALVLDYKFRSAQGSLLKEMLAGLKLQIASYLVGLKRARQGELVPVGSLLAFLRPCPSRVYGRSEAGGEAVAFQLVGPVERAFEGQVTPISPSAQVRLKVKNAVGPRSVGGLKEAFERLIALTEEFLVEYGDCLAQGRVGALPLRQRNQLACEWCPYQLACRYWRQTHTYRVARKRDLSDYQPGGEVR